MSIKLTVTLHQYRMDTALPPLLNFGSEPAGPFYGLPPIVRTPGEIAQYLASLEGTDDRQCASLDPETCSLRALCNANTPINRIPAEVLLNILQRFSPSIPPAPPSGDARYAWVPFMRVCRHWCALIRGTPFFWLNVVLGRSTQWTEVALPRTRRALFNLRTTSAADHSVVSRILKEHAGHISGLHLDITRRIDPSREDTFAPLHSIALPSLTTLNLYLPQNEPVLVFREELYPCLTSLTMMGNGNSLTWGPSLVAGLRTISLSGCRIEAPLTVAEFTEVLRGAVHLETIILYGFLHKALLPDSYSPPARGHVTLPNLQNLRCTDYLQAIGQLTGHLRLPNAGEIRLKGWSSSSRVLPEDHGSFFPYVNNADIAFFQSTTEATINLWDGFGELVCRTPELSVTLSLEGQFTSWEDKMDLVISQFATYCGGSPLTSVALKGIPCRVSRATWDDFFDHFAGLQTLRITVEHYGPSVEPLSFPDELFLSLATPSARGDLEDAACASPSARCPGLKSIQVNHWTYDVKHLHVLLTCLRARHEAGASRLEDLSLAPVFPEGEEVFPDPEWEEDLSEWGEVLSGWKKCGEDTDKFKRLLKSEVGHFLCA
ncbi:hypothetical protein C8Q78DRAFT_1074614 [Trametes maxima]|nr:hypothetical protein C8Q78DRAFT_1074614 [Trametes maxima]